MRKSSGFSLIEILAVMIIVVLLVVLSVPIYTNYLIYSNRTDAIQTLLAIQIAEEKYQLENNTYGELNAVWNSSNSVSNHYQISISNVTSNSYTITATATGNQANDAQNGASCATMILSYQNNTTTKTPLVCWTMS